MNFYCTIYSLLIVSYYAQDSIFITSFPSMCSLEQMIQIQNHKQIEQIAEKATVKAYNREVFKN